MLPEHSDSQSILSATPSTPAPVAPIWHTVLLMLAIVLLSLAGAAELTGAHVEVKRMQTYAFTAGTELCMVAWVYFGLRLRRVSFWSLFGSVSGSLGSIATDIGLALAFWIASLFILANIGLFWTVIEEVIRHQPLITPGKPLAPDPSQQQTLHTLTQLAPGNASEVLAWIGLCILAGIAEEVVFRGYLQRQFTVWARGAAAVGVALSAVMFGLAHGYQGARNMVMLSVFGALFSVLAVLRRSLRPGIFAHSWQDLCAGLVLAYLRAHHML